MSDSETSLTPERGNGSDDVCGYCGEPGADKVPVGRGGGSTCDRIGS